MTERQEETYLTRFWTNREAAIKLARKHGFRLDYDEQGTLRTGRESYFIFTRGPKEAAIIHRELDRAME